MGPDDGANGKSGKNVKKKLVNLHSVLICPWRLVILGRHEQPETSLKLTDGNRKSTQALISGSPILRTKLSVTTPALPETLRATDPTEVDNVE